LSNADANLPTGARRHLTPSQNVASQLPSDAGMLKLLGSIALARLLGFGILGFVVIYALLTLLT